METPTLSNSRPSAVAVWMLLIMAAAKTHNMSIEIRALLQPAVYWYKLMTYLYWEYYWIKIKGLARNDVNFLELSLIS